MLNENLQDVVKGIAANYQAEEIFFTDLEGNIDAPAMQDILEEIKPFTNSLKVLGCYPNSEVK